MSSTRVFVPAVLSICCALAAVQVGCSRAPGAPAGGPFVGDTGIIEGQLSHDWYYLGLEGGTLRSPHGASEVFLGEVSASLYRQRAIASAPEFAVYFRITPNTGIGSMGSAEKEDQAGWMHSRLDQGISALGGVYRRVVPSPTDAGALMEVGDLPVVIDEREHRVKDLVGTKWWFQQPLGRFELTMRTEGTAVVPRGFLCWDGPGSYRLVTHQFRDGRRFYEAYVAIPEADYVELMPEAVEFIGSLRFNKPQF